MTVEFISLWPGSIRQMESGETPPPTLTCPPPRISSQASRHVCQHQGPASASRDRHRPALRRSGDSTSSPRKQVSKQACWGCCRGSGSYCVHLAGTEWCPGRSERSEQVIASCRTWCIPTAGRSEGFSSPHPHV